LRVRLTGGVAGTSAGTDVDIGRHLVWAGGPIER
jgi:hypothetical protein